LIWNEYRAIRLRKASSNQRPRKESNTPMAASRGNADVEAVIL